MSDWSDEVEARLEADAQGRGAEGCYLLMRQRNDIRAALGEIKRLKRALERMVKDGCGFAPRVCAERSPYPEEWCWSCQAHAALQGGGE